MTNASIDWKTILRGSDDPIAAECLTALTRQQIEEVFSTSDVLAKDLFNIYSVRARINESKGSPIKGYERLTPALRAEGDAKLRVHIIRFREQGFVVFTDSSVARLVGILNRANPLLL